jgi:2,3-dihydroxy-2,3-dihydrophenylpropionate dehydrogenase
MAAPGGPAGWLDGQVAVITGGGTGIGAAVAARFVAEGGAGDQPLGQVRGRV